jgi:hypothetical protein
MWNVKTEYTVLTRETGTFATSFRIYPNNIPVNTHRGTTGNSHNVRCTRTAECAELSALEITLHVVQIVNTKQLKYVP